jgi:hypothetical protein
MFLDLDLPSALNQLGPHRLIRDETICPAHFEPVPHSPYREGYDWLFQAERKLAAFLDPWLQSFRHDLIGDHGLLSEILANAFSHGHRKKPELVILVRIFLGAAGLLIRVQDGGSGFDHRQTLEDFRCGRPYFHSAGSGLRKMAQSQSFTVFFTDRGSACHLLHLFPSPVSPAEEEWPEPIPWTQWADTLFRVDAVTGDLRGAWGRAPEDCPAAARSLMLLQEAARRLLDHMNLGPVQEITLTVGDRTALLAPTPNAAELILAVLKPDTPPAGAQVRFRKLYKKMPQ